MDRSELEIIKELMQELEDKMQHSPEDLGERLGRPKPGVEMVKIEGKMPESPELEKKEDEMGMDLDGDDEQGEDHADVMGHGMPMSFEDELKARLMKLRA